MDPYTVFDTTKAYGAFLLSLTEFYLLGASFFLGSAIAVGLKKSPSTPKGRETALIRKGWAVPLLLTISLGWILWGFYTLGIPDLSWYQLWGFVALTLGIFFSLKFPRVLGLPLSAGVIILIVLFVMGLQDWHPAKLEGTLAQARPLPEKHWELKKAGGFSLIPGNLMPKEVWILETPGYFALSGGKYWVTWRNPGTDPFSEVVHGLAQAIGLEHQIPLVLPPAPELFYPSRLVLKKPALVAWEQGL